MRHLVHHLLGCAAWLCALVALGTVAWSAPFAVATVLASAGLYLAAFALFHDAAHGALGVRNGANDVVLALAGRALLFSAHAQRRLHLRHHARPFAPDDVEGRGAACTFAGAFAVCLPTAARMHLEGTKSARGASPRIARMIAAEHAFSIVTCVAAVARPTSALGIYVACALALQLTMSVWASHVPHHPPAWFVRAARPLLWTRSPVLTSAVLHREHHALPKIAARALYDAT